MTNEEFGVALSENRVVLASIDLQYLVDCLNACANCEYVTLETTTHIPNGTRVTRMWNDPNRRCLIVELCHSSFASVPMGSVPPYLNESAEPIIFRRKSFLRDFRSTAQDLIDEANINNAAVLGDILAASVAGNVPLVRELCEKEIKHRAAMMFRSASRDEHKESAQEITEVDLGITVDSATEGERMMDFFKQD